MLYLSIGPMRCSVRPVHGRTSREVAVWVWVWGVHVTVCDLGGLVLWDGTYTTVCYTALSIDVLVCYTQPM